MCLPNTTRLQAGFGSQAVDFDLSFQAVKAAQSTVCHSPSHTLADITNPSQHSFPQGLNLATPNLRLGISSHRL